MNSFCVWIAQGFGLGKIPIAPGTFGSVGGLIWFWVLLSVPNPFLYGVGLLFGISVSVIVSNVAEDVLAEKDPGSVVIDEIVAVPVCFVGWLAHRYVQDGQWGGLAWATGSQVWLIVASVFVLFRIFDVAKPWPVRQVQCLAGGWGITVDDILAAIYVNLFVLTGLWGFGLLKFES